MIARRLAVSSLGFALLGPTQALAAVRIDAASAGRTEIGAGYQPVTRLDSTEPVASIEQRPSSGLRFRDHNWTWTTTYQQRWFLRVPNLADTLRPSLFHLCTTGLTQQLTPRTSLQTRATIGAGSMDYTRIAGVLSDNTNSAPIATRHLAALNILTLSADATLTYQLSTRTTVGGGLAATKQSPIGQNPVLGSYKSLTERITHSYTWSPRTRQTTTASAAEIWSRPASSFAAAAAAAGIDTPDEFAYYNYSAQSELSHQFSQRTTGGLTAGVSYFVRRGASANLLPLATATIANMSGHDGRRLTLALTTGVSAFVDTMTGRLRRTANAGANLTKQLDPYWTFQTGVTTLLPVSSTPVLPGVAESGATAAATLTRRLHTYGQLDIGARYVVQMTHPNDRDFRVVYRQSNVFVALSLWLGTDSELSGRWAL